MAAGAVVRAFIVRCFCSLVDPGGQHANLFVSERRLFVRHLRDIVCAAQSMDQQALAGVPGYDGRSARSAFAHERRRVQPQFPLVNLGTVAGKAMLRQDRLDLAEIIHRGIGPTSRSMAEKQKTKKCRSQQSHVHSRKNSPQREQGPHGRMLVSYSKNGRVGNHVLEEFGAPPTNGFFFRHTTGLPIQLAGSCVS